MAQFRSVGGLGWCLGTHLHAGYGGRIDREGMYRLQRVVDGNPEVGVGIGREQPGETIPAPHLERERR